MGTTAFTRGALLLVAGIVSLLASDPAAAAEQALSLPQVIAYALQNNGDLNALRAEGGLRDAGTLRAGLWPNPTLDIEAGSGALTGSSAENSLSLGISQEFFLAGKREKRLTIADHDQEIFRWHLADRERVLRETVQTAFLDLLLAEQRAALADRSIVVNRQLLDVARERLAAGDIPELELNLVKVEVARSEGARIDAAKSFHRSQAKLAIAMGLPSGSHYAVSGTLEAAVSLTKSVAELKRLALDRRPDLKVLAAEKARGDADISLARAEAVPNLTAGLAIRRDTTAMEIGGVAGKETAYSIGLKLSFPIPVFDSNRAGVAEARARQESAEIRLAAAGRHVEREVATAYAGYLNSEKVLALYQTNIIPQLEENLQLTREAYRLGEVGILAVIQEQQKFFEISAGYLAALHDRQTAFVQLEAAVAAEL